MKQSNILTIPIILSLLCLFVAGSAMAGDRPCNSGSDGGGSTVTGNHSNKSSWNLSYPTTNPTTINSGESVTIEVKNGQQNFNWSVTGSVVFFQETGNTSVPGKDMRELVVQAVDDVSCKEQVTITVEDNSNPTQTVQGTLNVLPEGSLEWDYDNSSTTVAATSSCTVAVIEESGGPYTWEISEGSAYFDAGFTQISTETTSNTTTVYTDNACGVIEVTVTDACGKIAVGQVRAPGQWVYAGEGCMVPTPLPNPAGKYRQVQTTCQRTYQQLCESCDDVTYPSNWGGTGCVNMNPDTCHADDEYAVDECRTSLCSDGYTAYCGGFEGSRYHTRRFLYCNTDLYYEIWTCP